MRTQQASGDASFVSAADASFAESSDAQDQLTEQNKLLNQLKDMIRQKDKQLLVNTTFDLSMTTSWH